MHRSITILIMMAAFGVAGADFRYDFGSGTSPLMPGFQRLTPSGGQGAAWQKDAVLTAHDQKIPVPGKGTPQVFLNELTCDYISGTKSTDLTLSVPPGKYRVWIAMGHPNGHISQVWNTIVTSSLEQKDATVASTWGMEAFTIAAEAGDEGLKLNISTKSRWLVNALIAVPEQEFDTINQSVIAPLWNEIMTFPPAEAKNWTRIKPPILMHHPEPQWSRENQDDGFAVFARNWCEPIWPEEFPRQSELNAPVRMFASPDEFETTSFAIHALKNFKEISLTVSSLTDESGNTLPELKVHYIRYMLIRSFYNIKGNYFEGPDVVMPWEPQSLDKGRNLRIWLTAHVPENAVPGNYQGNVEVNLDGKVIEVPVSLKVLPIKLYKDPRYVFGLYYRPAANFFSSEVDSYSLNWWKNRYDAELNDMRDTGFNMLMNGIGLNKAHAKRTVSKLAEHGINREAPVVAPARALYKKYMGKEITTHLNNIIMPPEEYFAEFREYIRKVVKNAEGENWPELLFYVADEPDGGEVAIEFMIRLLKIAREEGGKTSIAADLSKSTLVPLYPYVDVWITQDFSRTPEQMKELKKQYPHMRCWVYPNNTTGANDHVVSVSARMTFGFSLWKSEFTGLMPWVYRHVEGDQWNHLDGPASDTLNKTAQDGTPIASPNWIGMREGIDDGRYIYTLEKLISEAESAGHKAEADNARKVLNGINNAIPYHTYIYRELAWEGSTMDVYRWAIAQEIMKLHSLTEQK